MTVAETKRGAVTVLSLAGKIMGGPDAGLLNEKVHQLIDAGTKNVVLDLSQVQWMNSSGLGILISAASTLRNNGGELKLACITPRIRSLMTITRVINVFETFASVEEAVQSFS
ncbi:MAG: STAS domain-containing protein [candidate division KSB1 bacterium]|nr:STAS domain-containing protein [candidate division KSB1 bacterium]MDZ7294274.1 STAS domain-containing protein [candidate division KSB1 bacterium]MDZ7338602.1 STAS domain-containing protein [candidate division KSB1 bacterium]MDZ7391505.1 STAS domain-containing protein [candidate division KSB1 bacterium]